MVENNQNIKTYIESWKQKLLDISSRNQAINFRRRRTSTIQVVSPSMDDFLERILSSRSISFAEVFDDEEEDEETLNLFQDGEEDREDFSVIYGIKISKRDVYPIEELRQIISIHSSKNKGSYLYSNVNNKNQRKVLRNLMKKARTFKEENAINVLYFAIGYLEWYESKDSNVSHNAPLLFLPVELYQDSFDALFKINFIETDFLQNDSLIRKISQEFALDISYDFNTSDMSIFEQYQQYKKYLVELLPDKRWKTHDEIDLGVFSFSKINMVKDLENNEIKISNSLLVQQLIGITPQQYSEIIIDEENIDEMIHPEEYYHILEADSSQEIAIQSAIQGKSFVLQGPPGTGKSQTITNIITELIARNKKVLFVAEKKAALDVVYNNLKKINLHDYALPIHNSKLDKKEIVTELSSTLEKGRIRIEIDENKSNQLHLKYNDSKGQLIDYSKILLTKRMPINKNLYELYGSLLKYKKYPEIQFAIKDINNIDQAKLLEYEKLISAFYLAYSDINFSYQNHPWYGFSLTKLQLSDKEEVISNITQFQHSISKLEVEINNLAFLTFDKSEYLPNLLIFIEALRLLECLKYINPSIVSNTHINSDILKYKKLIELQKNMDLQISKIEIIADVKMTTLDFDVPYRIARLQSTFLKRLFSKKYHQIKNNVLLYTIEKKIDYFTLLDLLKTVLDYRNNLSEFSTLSNEVFYQEGSFKKENLENNLYDLEWYQKFIHLYDKGHLQAKDTIIQSLYEYQKNSLRFNTVFKNLYSIHQEIINLRDKISGYINFDLVNFNGMDYNSLAKMLSQFLNKPDTVEQVVKYNYTIDKTDEYGLKEFVSSIISNQITDHYFDVFLKRYYLLLVDSYLHQLLPGFDGSTMDIAKKSFADAERAIHEYARYQIEKNIVATIPNYNSLEGMNVEVSLLRSEANKSRRIMPFRVLFHRAYHLITKLKPCLMMSPLSVSTFLRDTDLVFDTVIFDEASQVKPENAIGSIFRAKQVIITGDKEQLPPTNFFQSVDDDETINEENYDTSAYDSILEVSSGNIESMKLRWHYRSIFEELITPSNKEIYHNLITFPSTRKPNNYEGIVYVFANGIYAERKNNIEADIVIEQLSNIIKEFDGLKSVGVVTFNAEQQSLIERKINHLRRINPEYEDFFSIEKKEPFFVKNIETVQGDERDIIIISVGYGPDAKGKVSMNFGPLNQTNGYRRLNVAVTRAKTSLVIISSIKGSDIDLNRTKSRGALFLKNYLEYAEFGEDEKVDYLNENSNFDSPFEEDVYNEIVKMGYSVKKQIGSSGYRIDLGVLNPKNPTDFILGIECDGATYHSSKSVRDRDRLRQQVLENRNWIIYRIWSTEWIKDKTTQVVKLKEYIESIIESKHVIDSVETTKVPVTVIDKQNDEPSFDEYPNYDELLEPYHSNYYSRQLIYILRAVIQSTSPIHENELKKIVPVFWGRQKYTTIVEKNLRPILKELLHGRQIAKGEGFYYISDQPIVFRKTTTRSNKRDFANIHYLELKDGILSLLSISKKMKTSELMTLIVNLCGYQSISSNMRGILLEVFSRLQKSGFVLIEEDYIEVINEYNPTLS